MQSRLSTMFVGPHPLLRAVPPAGHEERTLHHWGVRSLHSSEREHHQPNPRSGALADAMLVVASER